MPETPVDEDRHLPTGVANVRVPGNLPLEAIPALTSIAQSLSENQFGFSILTGVRTHRFRNVSIRWGGTSRHIMGKNVEV